MVELTRRPKSFRLLLSDEEVVWLKEMSQSEGVSQADLLRTLLRQEHRYRIEQKKKDKRSK